LSIPVLLDENPIVVSGGSGSAAVGGARSVPDHSARSNSERAAPSACVGNRFSAVKVEKRWRKGVGSLFRSVSRPRCALDRKSSNSDSRSDSFTKLIHALGRSIGH
jgi:hypothetical protein